MHPLLQTLDLSAGAGAESSVHDLHPIRQATGTRPRALPALLSLGVTPLLVYGLARSLETPALPVSRAVDGGRRAVALLLESPQLPPIARDPLGGEGHPLGTSSLDPRLAPVATTALPGPSDALDPEELSRSPRADLASLSLNPALPLQAGGNGLAWGTGRDATRGPGGSGRAQAPGAGPDLQVVPIRQVTPEYQLAPGQPAISTPVRVRLLIGGDGVPLQATIVSGPAFLHEKALKAAYQWRFEPLGPHGLEAPLSLTITFRPILLRPR
jgi:hypothetical protein